MVFLGKGYYSVVFSSRHRIWAQGSWNFKLGVFRVSDWELDFSPHSHTPLKVQIWIRLYLGMEYWHTKTLMEIAKAVGEPIRIDKATLEKTNGQYARILVEVDYNLDLNTDIKIVRSSFSFWVPVHYEYFPELCDNCFSIGHTVDFCRRKKVVRDCTSDEPAGKVNKVVFPKRGNRNKRKNGESLQETVSVQSDSLHIKENIKVQR